MLKDTRQISDLTIDEFKALFRDMMQDILKTTPTQTYSQAGLLDIPPMSVGKWETDFQFIRREEYYDDDF
jgi:hypothetical protein